jgi:hypothetical protein
MRAHILIVEHVIGGVVQEDSRFVLVRFDYGVVLRLLILYLLPEAQNSRTNLKITEILSEFGRHHRLAMTVCPSPPFFSQHITSLHRYVSTHNHDQRVAQDDRGRISRILNLMPGQDSNVSTIGSRLVSVKSNEPPRAS